MAISLNNLSVNEATAGVQIGTLSSNLSGSGTFSLLFHSNDPFLVIEGNTLSLKPNYFLDFETKYFISNTSQETNGRITQRSFTSFKTTENAGDDPTIAIKFTSDSGVQESQQFSISVVDKDESITVTPVNFRQHQYGATIAKVTPTDSYFSGKSVYFEGPSFLEIEGTNLKLSDGYYYSETGWVLDKVGSTGWNLFDSGYSADLNFTMLSGLTTASTDADGDGQADFGYTKIATGNYLSQIFSSSNINTTAAISLSPIPFFERDYGAIVATINYAGSESVNYSLANHTFFELFDKNKIKLKDQYFYNKSSTRIEDQNGISGGTVYPLALQGSTSNILYITATHSNTGSNLFTERITIDDISSTVFASSNVDETAQITITPIEFNDKQYGAIIANINYSGSETPSYTVANHSFFELTGTNKIKLKDAFYFDLNTGRVVKEDLSGYILANEGTLSLNILAKDTTNSKNLSSESITINDIINSVFGKSNVINRDESYTFVTDIKFQNPSLPTTGRKEYQKNISSQWVLEKGEKISYSFLEPGAAYIGTYKELNGLISIEDPFKSAARKAFKTISSFVDITFEEIIESGNIVGDFRIGITDANHFGMSSQYAAYSQGISNGPTGGNIFFNGGQDRDGDNIPDYNEAHTYSGNSRAFTTLMHEIIHSLGHKHPFEVLDATNQNEGNANIYQNQYEQFPYTIMSYTPLRDQETYNIKYEGVNLNSGGQYYPTTPMLFDIMALQEIYGAAQTTGSKDNTYTFLGSSPPFECIFDTGGNDILDFTNISGGTNLDLSGSKVSSIGDDYLIPWKNIEGSATVYGKPQGAPLGIVPGSDIEKVLLPEGTSTVTTGGKTTFLVGMANSALTVNVSGSEVGIKTSGGANDTINLKQTSSKWGAEFQARNMGNNGKGATEAIIEDMTIYLKHDLSLDLKQGSDTVHGTGGNDALFLQNFGTTGDILFYQDAGGNPGNARLSGVNTIHLLEGKNFLDLTSTSTSLAGESILITAGTNDDILWLSDADENVNSGNGNDQITVNGGTDILGTGLGSDIITISENSGNLTITDFDISKDQLIFKVASSKVTASSNQITVDNDDPLGDYVIKLTNNPDLSDLSAFSTFA